MQRRNDRTSAIEGREWGRLTRGDAHFTTSSRTQASIDAITRDDLVAFHQRYYHPGGFIFAVSGDVETEEILAKLDGYMAGWEASTTPVPPVPKPEHTLQPGLYLGGQARRESRSHFPRPSRHDPRQPRPLRDFDHDGHSRRWGVHVATGDACPFR